MGQLSPRTKALGKGLLCVLAVHVRLELFLGLLRHEARAANLAYDTERASAAPLGHARTAAASLALLRRTLGSVLSCAVSLGNVGACAGAFCERVCERIGCVRERCVWLRDARVRMA